MSFCIEADEQKKKKMQKKKIGYKFTADGKLASSHNWTWPINMLMLYVFQIHNWNSCSVTHGRWIEITFSCDFNLTVPKNSIELCVPLTDAEKGSQNIWKPLNKVALGGCK